MSQLDEGEKSEETIEDLLEARSRVARMLHQLRSEASLELGDTNSVVDVTDDRLIRKAEIISKFLRVGPLSPEAPIPELMKETVSRYERQIICPTTPAEFEVALAEAAKKAADSSTLATQLQEQFEEKQRLKPLLEEFASLLSSLASANHEQ